jgi:hypothetical protein
MKRQTWYLPDASFINTGPKPDMSSERGNTKETVAKLTSESWPS